MGEANLDQIIGYFAQRHEASASEVARRFDLHKSTLAGIFSRLEAKKIILRSGETASTGGRPSHMYRLCLPKPVAAFQMDASRISGAILGTKFEVLGQVIVPLEKSDNPRDIIKQTSNLLERLVSDAGIDKSALGGTAISINAVQVRGRIVVSSVLPWARGDLERLYATELGCKVRLLSSPRVLAEYQKLDPPLPGSIVSFRVGDGVSAHTVLNGQPYRGDSCMAGELGHISMGQDGPLCGCGKRGCLEAYCNGPAIQKKIVEELETGVISELDRQLLADVSPREAVEQVWSAWENGDNYARAFMEDILDKLAWGMGLVMNLLDPEMIVFSGYALEDKVGWSEEIRKRGEKWVLRPAVRHTRYASSNVTIDDDLRVIATDFFYDSYPA